MSDSGSASEFSEIFLAGRPLIDVRAPVEWQKGAFPSAVNMPLLDDEERRQVGTCYKQRGEQAAIDLGNKLVSGEIKQRRIARWKAFAEEHPNGYLYCFRGGLRSRTVQAWLAEVGVQYPIVVGGYKAMRRFLIEAMERLCAKQRFIIIGGRTGSGKTLVLNKLSRVVDLERLANHKGSSFGRSVDDIQPSQIDFENAVACDLMRAADDTSLPIVLEDESLMIGRVALPAPILRVVQSAPMVIVDEPLNVRIQNIKQDYVTNLLASYTAKFGRERGAESYSKFMLASLDRVKKRLGGARHQDIRLLMERALTYQQDVGDSDHHDAWISKLLSEYYDPMYDYQLSKKDQEIVFKGAGAEVLGFLTDVT